MDSENGCMAMMSDQNLCLCQKNNLGAACHSHWGLLESFTSNGPMSALFWGAEESSRGLWNESCGFWSYSFLWADFSEFDFTFKTGNTEPDSTHTLTHLPEESQIRKQQSCPKGPGAGLGEGNTGAAEERGEKKEREGDWNSSLQGEPISL